MTIRHVLRMGDARLLRRAEEVTVFDTPELHALLLDMRDTMKSLNGAGLAAPQIGVHLRVVIFGGRFNPRYPDAEVVPETVLINPVITPLTALGKPYNLHGSNAAISDRENMEDGWEGCLSVPGLRGLVPRFRSIHYRGQNESGTWTDRTVSGFHARVVQHECDHLDGILYPMRMRDLSQFGFTSVLYPDSHLVEE